MTSEGVVTDGNPSYIFSDNTQFGGINAQLSFSWFGHIF